MGSLCKHRRAIRGNAVEVENETLKKQMIDGFTQLKGRNDVFNADDAALAQQISHVSRSGLFKVI